MNSNVKFAYKSFSFLGSASTWDTCSFVASKRCLESEKSIMRESHCKSPMQFARSKSGTFGRCNLQASLFGAFR